MGVQYRGVTPDRNYSLTDFYENGVHVSWFARFKQYDKSFHQIRCIFRSNGLLGEIRSNGDGFAVDVMWSWGENRCLTTECKSVREAKSILFMWFKEKGFAYTKNSMKNDWRKQHLSVRDGSQLNLNPFVFKI